MYMAYMRVKPVVLRMMHGMAMFLFLISLNPFDFWSCSPKSTAAFKILDHQDECTLDFHCLVGQYCNLRTTSCVNCTDCKKYKMNSGLSTCSRGREECGSCETGFTMDAGGHCTPNFNSNSNVTPVKDVPVITSQEGINWTIIIILLCFLPLLITLAYVGFSYLQKSLRAVPPTQETQLALVCKNDAMSGETRSGKMDENELVEIPVEDRNPPAYFDCTDPIRGLAEGETEKLLSAIPFDLGNFSSGIQYREAVVPVQETEDVAPGQVGMLADDQMSSTTLDLTHWASERNSSFPTSEINELVIAEVNGGVISPSADDTVPLPRTSTPILELDQITYTAPVHNDLPLLEREESIDFSNNNTTMVSPDQEGPGYQGLPRNDSGNSSGHDEGVFEFDLAFRLSVVARRPQTRAPRTQAQEELRNQDWLQNSYIDISEIPQESGDESVDSGSEEHSGVTRQVPEQMDESQGAELNDLSIEMGD